MKYLLSYDENNIDEKFVVDMANKFLLDKNVVRLLYARGIDTIDKLKEYLHPNISQLNDPFLFEDMKVSTDIIKKHLEQKSNIVIFGDYDVDGITASAILIKYLKSLGSNVYNFLPNRYEDGYGLNIDALDKIICKYNPSLLITVDCGITAVDEIEYLKQKGIDVILTDHHEPGEILPRCPIINPKTSKTYPFHCLCGSGVALKLVQALGGVDILDEYIAMCAIATIADIVELLEENRAIVALGLEKKNLLPKGIKKLLSVCGLKSIIKASDIAFKIAPKINASGRMGDADRSLSLYLEQNDAEISKIVNDIISYNTQRQELCNVAYADAKNMLSDNDIYHTHAIILSSDKWDSGILGIVAARISEEFNRPTFMFSQKGDELVGSCRSVNNVNVHDLLTNMTDILEKFGGHTMAAGLTIKVHNFDEFVRRTNIYVKENFVRDNFLPTKTYDFKMSVADVNETLIKSIDRMEPCGHCNARPIFLFNIDHAKVSNLNKYPEHLTITTSRFSLLAFNSAEHYYTLTQNTNNHILADLFFDPYRSKGRISGIVKSIDYDDINRPESEEIVLAEYVKQMIYNDTDKYNFVNYNREELVEILLNANSSVFGTLFVAYDYNTYVNFKMLYDATNIIRNRIFNINDQTGLNTIILAPRNFEFFNTFNRIVFLDPVLHTGFISALNKATKATIFLPHKVSFSYSLFRNISVDRGVFGRYFRLFEYISDKNMTSYNLYSLYKTATKEMNKTLEFTYMQFVICLYVFVELGIVLYNESDTNIKVTQKKNVLNASAFYNRLCMLKMSKGE